MLVVAIGGDVQETAEKSGARHRDNRQGIRISWIEYLATNQKEGISYPRTEKYGDEYE